MNKSESHLINTVFNLIKNQKPKKKDSRAILTRCVLVLNFVTLVKIMQIVTVTLKKCANSFCLYHLLSNHACIRFFVSTVLRVCVIFIYSYMYS
jgi:hypothetical protein